MTRPIVQPDDLSPRDQRLLDALVECGFDLDALEALAPEDRRRADALMSVFELLEDYPVEDADESLVYATLARIDRHEDERAARMTFAAEGGSAARRFRMPDFISVAAVILIGVSILWPLLSHLRERSIDAGCANHLRQTAFAFDRYAHDFNGAMPIARAGLFEGWTATAENAVNLDPLVSHGYCDLGHLSCPGHDGPLGSSYSYTWIVPGSRPVWGVGRMLVLGDRNPIVDAARAGRIIPPLTMSLNHDGRGQNVLASDGQTVWLEEPLIGRNDNIWLPKGVVFLRVGDAPTSADDAFLAH